MKTNPFPSWAIALAFAALLTLPIRATTVTATLDSEQPAVGEPSQLTVTVSGSQEQPSVPSIDGLDITPTGQSTQIEIINGSMTANISDTYTVIPQREGTFVIPAIQAGNAASQPITLRVGKSSGTASSSALPAMPGAASNLPPPATESNGDDASAPQGRFGSIQVTLPKDHLYAGELVPVEIKAFIPDDVQANITDLPQMTSDAFALNSLSPKPEQTSQIIGNRAYTVLTWHTALTTVKEGDYPFSLKMPLSVVVPAPRPQTDGDDMFGDFFRNAMASMSGTKKDVTLQSTPQIIKVLPLPAANRPANFSGAVGQFAIQASAAPTTVSAGDPITLRLTVSGTGNFDRVSPAMLASDSNWKTYSVKSHFDAADSVGYQGSKTFEQPIIPTNSNVATVPPLSFNFFDPETQRYVTRTTDPVPITVNGSPMPASPTSSASPSVATAASNSAPPQPASDLRPNEIDEGRFVSTLRPIYLNAWFLAGQCAPVLALIGGLVLIRRQKLARQPQRARFATAQQQISREIAAMDAAMKNHETDAFFIHARSALQQRFAQEWNLRPETITLADIEARLGDESGTVRPIFEMADQASYSDLHFADADLREWRQLVLNELQPAEKN
jgi:hypothetical protein